MNDDNTYPILETEYFLRIDGKDAAHYITYSLWVKVYAIGFKTTAVDIKIADGLGPILANKMLKERQAGKAGR